MNGPEIEALILIQIRSIFKKTSAVWWYLSPLLYLSLAVFKLVQIVLTLLVKIYFSRRSLYRHCLTHLKSGGYFSGKVDPRITIRASLVKNRAVFLYIENIFTDFVYGKGTFSP